jgi:hypothetical protein
MTFIVYSNYGFFGTNIEFVHIIEHVVFSAFTDVFTN